MEIVSKSNMYISHSFSLSFSILMILKLQKIKTMGTMKRDFTIEK